MQKEERNPSIRVLVVHPYPVVRHGLAHWMKERPGFAITLADSFSSITEAVVWLQGHQVDLVLLEPWQGDMDALEAIKLLRATTGAHLLLLTAETFSDLHDSVVAAGVRGILPMHSEFSTVLTAIQRVAKGELWLSREATGRIFDAISKGCLERQDDPHQQRLSQLTPREREIVAVCLERGGATARLVAKQLHISEHTLRNHLTSIYGKLRVANRLELYAYAQRHGFNYRFSKIP